MKRRPLPKYVYDVVRNWNKVIKAVVCYHNWEERQVLVTPPEQYIQSQVSATLKECSNCGNQELIYDDEEYNEKA